MYTVFWVETYETDSLAPALVSEPQCKQFTDTELGAALKYCEYLRERARTGSPVSFVTLASEDANQVGQMGVNTITDGKLPDGTEYTWKKRRS